MKISTSLICLLLFCSSHRVKAQGLTPSTVRQIFSLEKGDSLEYHVWTVTNGCGTICNWYHLKTIDSISYNSLQDTLFIFFQSQVLVFDSLDVPVNPCGNCHEYFTFPDVCPVNVSRWSVTDLDSSVVYYLDTAYGGVSLDWATDSIYRNSLYNGSKQNLYNLGERDFSRTKEIYVDSIGIVYKTESVELADNNTEQLIYYHKANGKIWGTPYVVSGIANDLKDYGISIYPNPVSSNFVIRAGQYQGLHFKLFDALSKQVMSLNLSDSETEVNRSSLPFGVYFWQMSDGENVLRTGKLILE
jgi:hypothetical protein